MTVGMPGPLAYQFQNPCLLAGKKGWGSFGISSSSMACNSCIGGRSGSTHIAHRCRYRYTGNIGPPAWCGVQGPRQNRTIREESKSEKISNLTQNLSRTILAQNCVQKYVLLLEWGKERSRKFVQCSRIAYNAKYKNLEWKRRK